MVSSFSAELLKLRKRPAVWILLGVFLAAFVLFGYFFTYIFTVSGGGNVPQEIQDQALQGLLPENVISTTLSQFVGFGSAIVLILGALSAGNEYGWDTLKTVLARPQSRLGFFSGKLLALLVVLAVFTVVVFVAGALSSYVVASLEDAAVEWPAVWEFVKAAGAGLFILAVFTAMGFVLATLLKGVGLAIGIGLVYLLVLENIFIGLQSQSDTFQTITKALPVRNAIDLTRSFGELAQVGAPQQLEVVDPGQAVLVLGAYLVAFVGISLSIFRARDVA